MKEVNYKKLNEKYKNMFDMCAFIKTDHKDMNDFKLYFNEQLLNIFLEDQASNVFRGLSGYAEVKAELHEKLERQFFLKNGEKISIESINRAIDEGNFISFDFSKEDGKYRYNFICLKIIISTLELSKEEKTFLSANINTSFDESSHTGTLAIATLHRQRRSLNMLKLEKWAKNIAKRHVMAHFKSIEPEHNANVSLKGSIEHFLLNLYAKHLI